MDEFINEKINNPTTGDTKNDEAVIESKSVSENENSKNDLNSKTIKNEDSFSSAVKIFGVSEEKLFLEFGAFKASKLFKRSNYLITNVKITQQELKRQIIDAISLGVGSVTVLSSRLKEALYYAENKIAVRACCHYPYGSEPFPVIKKTLKRLAKLRPSGIELPIDISTLLFKKQNQIVKEWSAYKKAAKKSELIMVVDFDLLSESEIKLVCKIAETVKVKIKTSTCILSEGKSIDCFRTFLANYKAVKFELTSTFLSGQGLLSRFSLGADTVSSNDLLSSCHEAKTAFLST